MSQQMTTLRAQVGTQHCKIGARSSTGGTALQTSALLACLPQEVARDSRARPTLPRSSACAVAVSGQPYDVLMLGG